MAIDTHRLYSRRALILRVLADDTAEIRRELYKAARDPAYPLDRAASLASDLAELIEQHRKQQS